MRKELIFLFLVLFLSVGTAAGGDKPVVTFVKSWGIKGALPGYFNEPYGIAVDNKGFVYVTDARNARVQKFTEDGEFVLEWGGEGNGNGKFQKPVGIAMDGEGFIYVTDYDDDTVRKFDGSGKFVLRWGKTGDGEGEFDAPSDITSIGGKVYVVDLYNHRVQKFDTSGRFLKAWGGKRKVENWRSVLSPLFPGERKGEFYYPAKIAAGDGKVYVSDSYNNRVQVFTVEGEHLAQWGGMGFWKGRFRVASGIALGPEGRVFVADFYNDRVQVFGRDGSFLTSFGNSGIGSGEFRGPLGVAVNNKGYLYVVDWKNHRVQVFRMLD